MGEANQLRISCWNARGYLSSIPYLRKLLIRSDVLAISEHWLPSNRLNFLSKITESHYVFARSSNACTGESLDHGRGQGGVAIFWRKSIPGFCKVSNIIHDRACVVRYQPQPGEVYFFVSVYLPSQGGEEDLRTVLDEISEVIESREVGSHVIILGDLNGDVGSLGGPRGVKGPTQRGRYVMEFFERHGLSPTNMQATAHGPVTTFNCHNSSSTLDYIAVPLYLSRQVKECAVAEWDALNTSDHTDVRITLQVEVKSRPDYKAKVEGKLKWGKLETRGRYCAVTRLPLTNLKTKINRSTNSPDLLDPFFEELTGILHGATAHLPRSKYVSHLKPYWNEDLSSLKKEKVKDYRAWVAAGRPRDPLHPLMISYKNSKKAFAKTIKRLSKRYENEEIRRAVELAEVNRNSFWHLLRKCRSAGDNSNISIRGVNGVVVSEVRDVLEVWRRHFANLGTPKDKPTFDNAHYRMVSTLVHQYNDGDGLDDTFLTAPFSISEIRVAIKNLNTGKAAGFDMVTAEHLLYADSIIEDVLLTLYNMVREHEVIPSCFRNGIQIPLFKGKDLDVLDPNNYRGITLLSTFNKTFEILIWHRLKKWWTDEGVISELQGACKSGLSCIHTAFLLQETLATSMETNEQCFLAFFDVAKAFDTVWIDGLFKQIYDIGITGKTWRLLYRCYIQFFCRVRVEGNLSEYYSLHCGIHQGGYLSLLKYTVFINSLLISLKESGLCAKIYATPSTPLGYADDLAACCLTKRKTDAVMDVVYTHGCTWRYDFNARKSGVLVVGENPRTHLRNAAERRFNLGPANVREVAEYDHVGIKTSIFSDNCSGIDERISKARRALNAVSGLGIRKNGLNIATCNIIFWSIVVPIATFGCELWRLNDRSINSLETFQIYAGKRIQRFFHKTPNICSFYGLGWMRLSRYIQVRKLLFVRALLSLDQGVLSRKTFIERATRVYNNDISPRSGEWSIVVDLLEVADIFNLSDEVRNMVLRDHYYPKNVWKRTVWDRGWSLEDTHWCLEARLYKELDILTKVCSGPRYLTWWSLSNKFPEMINVCESIAKMVSHSSLLKCDDVRLKSLPRVNRTCSLCDLFSIEDPYHIIMQCPGTQPLRNSMFTELESDPNVKDILNDNANEVMLICMGKCPNNVSDIAIEKLWCIAGSHINGIYKFVLNQRKGVG